MPRPFRDRADAGRHLARRLISRNLSDPLVLALPRGGVPVASEIATALDAPLEVFVARKIGMPGHPERGIGAIAEGGIVVTDGDTMRYLQLSPQDLAALVADERRELHRRVNRYRGSRPLPHLADCDVILVDDGLATGVTAAAALLALRRAQPRWLCLAAPVGAPSAAERLAQLADEVVCLHAPADFMAVGCWYDDFSQTSDREVLRLLTSHLPLPRAGPAGEGDVVTEEAGEADPGPRRTGGRLRG